MYNYTKDMKQSMETTKSKHFKSRRKTISGIELPIKANGLDLEFLEWLRLQGPSILVTIPVQSQMPF